jgi:hypothetical protein
MPTSSSQREKTWVVQYSKCHKQYTAIHSCWTWRSSRKAWMATTGCTRSNASRCSLLTIETVWGGTFVTEPTPTQEARKMFLPFVQKGNAPAPEPTPTPTPGPSQKVAIDPITRIEGHLRIEVQIEDGQVTNAWSAGMMFRGIELLMPGRDPRDAWVFTQRICGV